MSCSKKSFSKEQEAIAFEIENRSRNYNTEQNPYRCEECGSYHLTATKPGTHSIAQVNYVELAKFGSSRAAKGETTARVAALVAMNPEFTAKQIAERLNMSEANVNYHRQKLKPDYDPARKGPYFPQPKATLRSVTIQIASAQQRIDDLRRGELKVEQQLAALKAQEESLRGQSRMTLNITNDGVVIEKNAEKITLTLSDCESLVTQVEEFLTRP